MKYLIDIINIDNQPNIIQEMGHRKDMKSNQRIDWDLDNYKKRLKSNKGHNYEYWKDDKHNILLEIGWQLFSFSEKTKNQWGNTFRFNSTSSEDYAIKKVIELRVKNNYARIICGYDKNKQRTKMYSIIFKPKKS